VGTTPARGHQRAQTTTPQTCFDEQSREGHGNKWGNRGTEGVSPGEETLERLSSGGDAGMLWVDGGGASAARGERR
jgi:hypothetical protein